MKAGLGPFGERILEYSEHDLEEGLGFRLASPYVPHLVGMGMAVEGKNVVLRENANHCLCNEPHLSLSSHYIRWGEGVEVGWEGSWRMQNLFVSYCYQRDCWALLLGNLCSTLSVYNLSDPFQGQ